MKKLTMILMLSLFAAACGSDTPTDDNKPTVDPDSQFVDSRADGLSNHYTTIMGKVDPMDQVNASIDYPDYFHGYLIELEEGAEMSFSNLVAPKSARTPNTIEWATDTSPTSNSPQKIVAPTCSCSDRNSCGAQTT